MGLSLGLFWSFRWYRGLSDRWFESISQLGRLSRLGPEIKPTYKMQPEFLVLILEPESRDI